MTDIYSRNLYSNNNYANKGNTLTQDNIVLQEKIPVKSFKDDFAYDRFSKLGKEEFNIKKSNDDIFNKSLTLNKSEEEQTNIEEEKRNADIAPGHIVNLNQSGEQSECSKKLISKFIDSDVILLLATVLLISFSENTTNDKLTPLALLAILLL